ncbi:hypothetical protein [Flagellimonas sp. CMM7]|uniref:hypothetical protein n=1 Tax=Flagellimonas sp. CMM7 TaxID=2654676 RepID=UPI0013D720BA|nr:hypothetical protein [Flagellimonas sp. CMM7]UII80356.1 hypothetical protein LV704_02305 [Flagellimonas sp. CMM7]
MDYTNKQAADLIAQSILLLKSLKITQQEIELRLNYTSLSKAKNFDRYPQVIIEKKTRVELLQNLFAEFGLQFNEEFNRVEVINGEPAETTLSDVQYYIMHYYAFARGIVDRALVQIVNRRKVIMDYRIPEHWEGTYNVIENYTFIEMTKMGYTTPVKKLLSLFSGTMKYGHKYLLGTYSTVKKDGFPAAGRVILEKVSDEGQANKALAQDSDYRIVSYLKDNVYITKLFTPNNLNEIVSTHHNHYLKLVGSYKFIMPAKNDTWNINDLIISRDFTAQFEFNDVIFNGYVNFININVLNIIFTRKNQDSASIRKQVLTLDVNVRKTSTKHIFTCTASSPIIHGVPSSFSAYIILSENFKKSYVNSLERNLFLGEPLD